MQLILKRLMACVYELLILIAIWMLFTWLYVSLFGDATHGAKRLWLQLLLWLITGFYFVMCWVRTGQTLAMQAWKMKIVNQEGRLLSWRQAILRYVLASVLTLMFGLSLLYMLVNRQRLFLHDQLLGSRYVVLAKVSS
jgi:uncharacterized RDD family membrane protein YckC